MIRAKFTQFLQFDVKGATCGIRFGIEDFSYPDQPQQHQPDDQQPMNEAHKCQQPSNDQNERKYVQHGSIIKLVACRAGSLGFSAKSSCLLFRGVQLAKRLGLAVCNLHWAAI